MCCPTAITTLPAERPSARSRGPTRVLRARASLQWPEYSRSPAIRRHATGTSLALAAPFDQLFTATEINEWALCASLVEADPARWSRLEAALVDVAREAAMPARIQAVFASALPVLDEEGGLPGQRRNSGHLAVRGVNRSLWGV